MAQTKKELLAEAEKLGIEIVAKAKIADIKKAIETHAQTVPEVEPVENEVSPETTEASADKTLAKAGKRSAKALEEEAEKLAKEERKASGKTEKPKAPIKPARSRLERRGKLFRKSAEQIEKGKLYSLEQAIALAQKTSHVKFDATVELHVNLGVDPKLADQNVRDSLVLPAGSGKSVRVVVADDALLAKLDKGTIDFDVLISTPEFMAKLGKYARVLGPRGLMPNPKSGTVTTDVEKAVTEAKGGRVEYRVDASGIVHLGVGKVSFTAAQLLQNVQAVMASLKANKPNGLKGNYINSIYLTTSMGPSVAIDPANAS